MIRKTIRKSVYKLNIATSSAEKDNIRAITRSEDTKKNIPKKLIRTIAKVDIGSMNKKSRLANRSAARGNE